MGARPRMRTRMRGHSFVHALLRRALRESNERRSVPGPGGPATWPSVREGREQGAHPAGQPAVLEAAHGVHGVGERGLQDRDRLIPAAVVL